MTHPEALQKVAKLLRLAQSSNPNEAAQAAAKAQEIMDRWKLSASDVALEGAEPIASNEPIQDFKIDPLDREGRDRWKYALAAALCRANQCKAYGRDGGLCLIGRASDVQTIRYLYAWISREIERLAARDCRGTGRTYWNNFRIGAVESVSKRLSESANETVATVRAEASQLGEGASRALAVVNNQLALMQKQTAAVEQWAKSNLRLRSSGGSGSAYNSNARAAGRAAGAEIRISGARGAIGSGEILTR